MFALVLTPAMAFGQAPAKGWGLGYEAAQGQLEFKPDHLRFYQVAIGQQATLTVTMTNTGAATVNVLQVNQNAPEFTISNLKLPLALKMRHSVKFNVTFTPRTSGRVKDALEFISDAANDPAYVYLNGVGVPVEALTANPPAIHFGNVQVGDTEPSYETLTNTGTSTVTITKARLEDPAYSIQGLDLPAKLTAGQSVTFTVVFAPQSEGANYGRIIVVSDAPNSKLTIPLAGTGTAAGQLSVSPKSMDFGPVPVGSSKKLAGELTASGSDVTVSSAFLPSSEFTLSGLSFPFTVPNGQKATFIITFEPQARGRVNSKVSFESNAANSPTVESLSGAGTPTQHAVGLSWEASSSPDVIGYNVYRSKHRNGSYGKLNDKLDRFTLYTDPTVQGGETYFYATTAVDSAGNESVYSNIVKAVIPYP
jgi:hypothetical protein